MYMNATGEKLYACSEYIRSRIPLRPAVALVLGSGLGDFADNTYYLTVILNHFRYRQSAVMQADTFSDILTECLSAQCKAGYIFTKDTLWGM